MQFLAWIHKENVRALTVGIYYLGREPVHRNIVESNNQGFYSLI